MNSHSAMIFWNSLSEPYVSGSSWRAPSWSGRGRASGTGSSSGITEWCVIRARSELNSLVKPCGKRKTNVKFWQITSVKSYFPGMERFRLPWRISLIPLKKVEHQISSSSNYHMLVVVDSSHIIIYSIGNLVLDNQYITLIKSDGLQSTKKSPSEAKRFLE